MLRRTLATAAVTALAGAALTMTAAPADAVGVCNLTVPAKASIWKPYQAIPIKAAGDCVVPEGEAIWDLTHPSGDIIDYVYFGGTANETWDLYADLPTGVSTWHGGGAFGADDVQLDQNAPTTDVRLHGAAWIASKRTNDVVTLTGTALRYNWPTNTFVKRSGYATYSTPSIWKMTSATTTR